MASSSRPIHLTPEEEKNTLKRGMKRSPSQLSPAPPAVKKQKIQKSASIPDLRDGSSSSSSKAVSADAVLCQATSAPTHEMVLKNVWCAELLKLLGEFLCRRYRHLRCLTPEVSTTWLRTVDMLLVVSRAQWKLLTCFYVACSYIGTNLGYPALPFMLERSRQACT